jgi:uncharacterized hydrophobic protein (TIGR00341 family)
VRLVQVIVPAGKRGAVLEVLEEESIDYVVTDEDSNREYTAVVYFPLPTSAVEPILDDLRETGLEEESYTVILETQTVISRKFDELTERYEADEGESEDRIPREEIRAGARALIPSFRTFIVMVIASAIVATAGLLVNSAAVVVGSMVIAPVIGPALATSVGTVIKDEELFREGFKLQVIGFSLAVIAATAFALLARATQLVPPGVDVTTIEQVQGRLSPDFLSLAVALSAGVAGALSLSTGVSAALVGVMIAAALIPPVAAVGIGIAWGLPRVIFGASVLVILNALAVNLATLIVFWLKNYRPESWFRLPEARVDTLRRSALLIAGLVVVSAVRVGVTLSSIQTATSEQVVRDEIEGVLADEEEYENLSLISVEVRQREEFLGGELDQVVVVVGRPSDEFYPGLATNIDQRIEERTGDDVHVQVQFVEVSEA